MTIEEKVLFLGSAMREIVKRLEEGETESSLSIAKSSLIAIKFGFDSSEFIAFVATEKARLESV